MFELWIKGGVSRKGPGHAISPGPGGSPAATKEPHPKHTACPQKRALKAKGRGLAQSVCLESQVAQNYRLL